MTTLKASAQKVQDAIYALGYQNQVQELPDSTRTAAEAAEAVGCEIAQIAKSLIFRGAESGQPILIIASGAHRVDEKKMTQLIGEKLRKPNADFVREKTGYAIGGVPPLAHAEPMATYLDESFWQHERIWAAAGHPFALFSLTPDELQKMTDGTVVAVI